MFRHMTMTSGGQVSSAQSGHYLGSDNTRSSADAPAPMQSKGGMGTMLMGKLRGSVSCMQATVSCNSCPNVIPC